MQNSPSESTILFLYANSPCIVFGRNQNPWLEVNLDLVRSGQNVDNTRLANGVQILRRRSGGGAVFHDEGNMNYSVICPPADFTRDKHVEMVTGAIRKLNERARVTERHDIVLDQGRLLPAQEQPSLTDLHQTKFHPSDGNNLGPLKVSGSAYKLIRNRSLHHGTCLLASPNLSSIGQYLSSPARPFMKAKGVESVRSPIGNICEGHFEDMAGVQQKFVNEVVDAFQDMHVPSSAMNRVVLSPRSAGIMDHHQSLVTGIVGSEARDITEISHGMGELKVGG